MQTVFTLTPNSMVLLCLAFLFALQLTDIVYGQEHLLRQNQVPAGGDEEPSVPKLIRELKDADEHVRRQAAAELGLIGTKAKDAVPALMQALRDRDASVRRHAVIALWSIGRSAKDAIPALIEARKDGDNIVRTIVPFAVRHIRLSTVDTLSIRKGTLPATVIEALNDPDKDIRWDAVFVLLRFAWLAEAALPALITRLQDADVTVRAAALRALAMWPADVGSVAQDSMLVLIRALEDTNEHIRHEAIAVFTKIRSPKEAVPALIKALYDVNESIRGLAVRALGGAEPTENVMRALSAALHDADIGVSGAAVFVLSEFAHNGIASAPKEAVPSLIAVLKDSRQPALVRQMVVDVLVRIGPSPADAVPALIVALQDPERFVRRDVAWALGDIGSVAKDAVPALITSLRDREWAVRFAAAWALGEIGPDAKDAIPELIAAFREPDWPVHLTGAFALAKLGPTARDAVPMLVAALKDPNREVGEVAKRESGYEVHEGGLHASEIIHGFEFMLSDLLADIERAQVYKEERLEYVQIDQDHMRKLFYGEPIGGEEDLKENAFHYFDNPLRNARWLLPDTRREPDDKRSYWTKITVDEWLKIAVRFPAAYALRGIGAPAVPALIPLLDDSEWFVRFSVIWALQGGGTSSLPALKNAAINDSDYRIQYKATRAMSSIGRPAVPVLLSLLQASDDNLRSPAIEALGQIGPEAKEAVPVLVAMIQKTGALDQWERITDIVEALGSMKAAAIEAVPVLTTALQQPAAPHEEIAASLVKIAEGLQDSRDTSAIAVLEGALEALNRIPQPKVERSSEILLHAGAIRRFIDILKLLRWTQLKDEAVAVAQAHPWVLLFPGYVVWSLVWLLIFWIHPYTVLRAANLLRPFDLHVPTMLGRVQVALQYLLFVGFLKHHPRVLDAWVERHIDGARKRFAEIKRVQDREIHIPLPVELDKNHIQNLSCRHLRQAFNTRSVRLLIWERVGLERPALLAR